MNATSSRAHTVFTLQFTSVKKDPDSGTESETTSKINLVDLAGSERSDSTGATGDRLKEGCAINQSLSALGNVIKALADVSSGKKKVFIPYRNSVLTRLLQDALGGNSKTIMIAALSPADVNYDETLSTLRYADRAKQIKNKVVKNENPTDKLIRKLKEENKRLMKLLSGKGIDAGAAAAAGAAAGGGDVEELRKKIEEEQKAKMAEQMKENERIMAEMTKSWETKLAEAMANRVDTADDSGAIAASSASSSKRPYLLNLHEDPQLSECVMYAFKEGMTKIGRKDAPEPQDIKLAGLNIKREHCQVTNEGPGDEGSGHKVTIKPVDKSKTFINGELVTTEKQLKHLDRVILGNNFVFRYQDPLLESPDDDLPLAKASEDGDEEAKKDGDDAPASKTSKFTWQEAMDEFTTKQGLRLQNDLNGRVNKLEEEEAAKRKELEEKLKAMEEKMKLEREKAEEELKMQRQLYEQRMAGGESISEEERAKLQSVEADFKRKQQELAEELEKQQEMSSKMLEEQLKRKRQTKKIEADLQALMPLVNEANLMAEELNKPVRFEVRPTVKSPKAMSLTPEDELKELKKIVIMIRVTSTEDASLWNWSHTKFDNRLYMMREMYQNFIDYGPSQVPLRNDPFWDPPEACTIGSAFVYLKALSQLVEIENTFGIVDYRGDQQGSLQIELFPEGPHGEELDYLASSEEIIGKSVTFVLRIICAKGLPAKYANEVFVSYSFLDEQHETKPCESKTTDPEFNYEFRFAFDSVDERLRQFLLSDAIVFEIKGFTDAQSQNMLPEDDLQPDFSQQQQQQQYYDEQDPYAQQYDEYGYPIDDYKDPMGMDAAAGVPAGAAVCQQCEEMAADWHCVDCDMQFCDSCFSVLHKSKKKKAHVREPIPVDGGAAAAAGGAGGGGVLCEQCEEDSATLLCLDCDLKFCQPCFDLLHRSKKKAGHATQPLDAGAAAGGAPAPTGGAPMCEQCEEQQATLHCVDCGLMFCPDCNDLLHKSKKKAAHQRNPI
eukprot:TRINITY_DN66130_c1_g7_i1.p1 TRINITY_DN66130_c1_g7~~TRINITY_DN66130_c1_g7_i1.p1  ORF type:complete len:1115 (-),score=699.87 TRINITY_DN66130_c1_g7_i1:56-3073(-)